MAVCSDGDHPRVCGEHLWCSREGIDSRGSSPRVRGTLEPDRPADHVRGIIPACAGNTSAWLTTTRWFRDHPRVCGEHKPCPEGEDPKKGSSPRVRGTLVRAHPRRLVGGIIPACAGNTSASIRFCADRWDHPRVCGEHRRAGLRPRADGGSSPRVRGTLAALTARDDAAVDHPRVCGEHRPHDGHVDWPTGSSPRVRGTRRRRAGPRGRLGIIPACAGNTATTCPYTTACRDHPRVCGEHCQNPSHLPCGSGSSPRVRGTPVRMPSCVSFSVDHPRVCGEHR